MTQPKPFEFGRDFREQNSAEQGDLISLQRSEFNRLIEQAEETGFARGLRSGQENTLQGQMARIADACNGIAQSLKVGLDTLHDQQSERKSEAMELALLVAQKISTTALERFPLSEIEKIASECFKELQTAPHIVVKVSETILEEIKPRMASIASQCGFSGRLIVMGEPDLAPSDTRIEWADGGIIRDQAAIMSVISIAIQRHMKAIDTAGEQA